MNSSQHQHLELCPCGSGKHYADCCGQYLAGTANAPTAEALMRSRYTAFVFQDEDYLRDSWHPDTRPADIDARDADIRWLGLKIKRTEAGGEADDTGTVEFVARYKTGGRGHRLHETSRFVRHAGRWVYLEGVHAE